MFKFKLKFNHIVYLLIIFVLVVILLIAQKQSIWLDEGLTLVFSQKTVPGIISLAASTDLHPPLYYLLFHFFGGLFGFSIALFRWASLIFYFLSALLLWWYLKKRQSLTEFKTTIFVLVFCLSPFALYYAGEVRGYALIILISLLHFVVFDDLVEEVGLFKSNFIKYFLYTFSGIINVYLFYPIIFSLIAEFIYIVWRKKELFKKIFICWLIIFLSYLPWIYLVIIRRLSEAPGHFLAVPWWQIPAVIFLGFAGGRTSITDLNHLHWYWPTIIIGLVYLFTFIGYWFWWKSQQSREFFIRIATLFFLPVIICLVISAMRFSIFDPRYYTQLFPLFIILLIYSSQALMEHSKKIWRMTLILLFLGNFLFIGLYLFNPWFQREPWELGVAQVEQELQPQDALVFVGYQQPPPSYTVYQKKMVPIISTHPDWLKNPNDYQAVVDYLMPLLRPYQRIWYSQYLEWQKDPNGQIRAAIEKEFKYQNTVGFFKVKFDLYQRIN